jgi:hypothetical protein
MAPPQPHKQLERWLQAMSRVVSKVSKSQANQLYDVLIRVDWAIQTNSFFAAYRDFLENLVVVNTSYLQPVLRSIVNQFKNRKFPLCSPSSFSCLTCIFTSDAFRCTSTCNPSFCSTLLAA